MIPDEVDLVIIEFSLNDAADEKTRRILSIAKKNTILCENEMDSPMRQASLISPLLYYLRPSVCAAHSQWGSRCGKIASRWIKENVVLGNQASRRRAGEAHLDFYYAGGLWSD